MSIACCAAVLMLLGTSALAQSALEQLAKQQISQKTGLDPNQLAVIFVTNDQAQFVLAFALINQRMMQSQLKPELKQAVSPFVGQKAMLVLVAPTRPSPFDPFQISFQQNNQKFSVGPITPITPDFGPNTLQPQTVSAGIVLLHEALDLTKNFKIFYNTHSTVFSITGQSEAPAGNAAGFLLFLQLILFQILLIFLIPFLIGL
jgi:hypothetical protein